MSLVQPFVDYGRWPDLKILADLDEVAAAVLDRDGVISVRGNHPPVDILTSGIAGLALAGSENKTVLVGLSGAVANRSGKLGPFFSGVGIAAETGLPLIAISDPTLALDGEVPLAWYAGNQFMPDLPERLARMLSALVQRVRCKLLLFGGSGGGFAALQLAPRIGASATALVWNPQTAIADYVPLFVAQYIATAFPTCASEANAAAELPASQAHARLRDLLEGLGVAHDVRDPAGHENGLLYLQNLDDWHLPKHAVPFMRGMRLQRSEGSTLRSARAGQAIWLGQWGSGHAPPPKAMIIEAMVALARGDEPCSVAEALQRTYAEMNQCAATASSFNFGTADYALSVRAELADGNLLTSTDLQPRTTPAMAGIMYAFYLLKDGKRHQARWYESGDTASFVVPDEQGRWQVQAYAKDRFGDVLVSSPVDLPSADVFTPH